MKLMNLIIFEIKTMKTKLTLAMFLFCLNIYGQENVVNDSVQKENPIVFCELYFGIGGGNNSNDSNKSLTIFGANVNYQFNKRDLITARFSGLLGVNENYYLLGPIVPFPFSVRSEEQQEYALLYGKRWVNNGFSFSASAGISYIDREYYQKVDDFYEKANQSYFGFPIELNVKWFKAEKKVFRAYYGIIPIGKRKVSFGRSVGFKLIGNFAKNNYLGVAFTYGLGWHKKY